MCSSTLLFFFLLYFSFCFRFFTSIPIGITSYVIGLKISDIPTGIKKHNSMIKKMKKKHDKIVLQGKTKLDTVEVLNSNALLT